MMIRLIQNLYKQHGHTFYRDGLNFSQQSTSAFLNAYYYQEIPDKCSRDEIVVACTLQNIGKMIDKNSSYLFASHLLSVYGFPPSVYKPIGIIEMARNYLYTTNPHYRKLLTPYFYGKVEKITPPEIKFFKRQVFHENATVIALNEVANHSKVYMTKDNWKVLEKSLYSIYQRDESLENLFRKQE